MIFVICCGSKIGSKTRGVLQQRSRPERVEIILSRKLFQHAVEQARARQQPTKQFLTEVVESALAGARLEQLPPSPGTSHWGVKIKK